MSNKKNFDEHPKAQYWHPTKNGETKPNMVSHGSAKKYWFLCNVCNHDFKSDPNHITAKKNPTWCPYCASRTLCNDDCKICLEKSFGSHPKSVLWYKEKNGNIMPRNVFISSNKKYWLQCNEYSCKHIFDVRIADIVSNDGGCPYCTHKRLCKDIECEPCMRRSFASHPRAKYWDKEKNGDTIPRDIFPTSTRDKPFWFKCDNEHSFCDTLSHITSKTEPRWCGICSKDNKLQVQSNIYLTESREIAKERNGKLLSILYVNMHELLMWYCNICEYTWSACLSSIKQGSWCPKCAKCIPYTLDDCHAFAKLKEGKCLSNQYINNSIPIQWKCKDDHIWNTSYANVLNGTWCPHCVKLAPKTLEDAVKIAEKNNGECLSIEYINARAPLIWKCKNDHTWNATYDSISGNKSTWCPQCNESKGEKNTRELIEKITGKAFPKIKKIFTNPLMELDGYNDEMKIGFEHQGIQHYQFIPFFQKNIENFEKQCERDQQKRDECKSLGIHLIEVPYSLMGKEKEEFINIKLQNILASR